MDYQKRFILALFLLIIILSLGSLGYYLIENISILDAVYMTLITISTVGFREVTNLSVLGKLFTMVLIIAGVGILFYTLTTTLEFIIEGHLKGVLEKRRKEKHMKKLKNHFIICGFGKVGKQVVSELKKYKFPLIVVENNPKKVENSIKSGNLTIEGDASLENILIEAGIERSKGLVSAVDTDADNVFIVLTARSINEKLFIVSRADSYKAIKKLEKAGANRVISPAIIGGRRMATMLFKPLVCDFLDVVSQSDNIEYQLEEIVVQKNSTFINSMIKDSGIREKHGALVLAIQKRTGELSTSPSPETIIEENDKLVIMGTKWQINSLNEALNK